MRPLRIFKLVSIADSLSILNALLGLSAITYIFLYSFDYRAFQLLIYASIIDGIDGTLARKTEKSPIGKELDSLADSISFGLLPALALISYEKTLFPFSSLLLAFSILRLARFNIESFKDFYGLPTVPNALFLCGLILMEFNAYLIAAVSILTSLLMISDIVYPRVGKFSLIAAVILLLVAFFEKLLPVLVLSIAAYILYPPVRLIYGRCKSSV
ncbi:MAG: CDP-diacylglycerol--serine O-phosphatidyltransferase [Archaeoglobaceae archaeon]|nr:CDP-diacylglycerol--serine O-phosphatidyltransferase [Archaeoglobaceae archaeon]MCX8152265.1 CDP-diacylglycerol--serine O-phosphatidyltransferase [Archaeoglobaceae archaeon]MDW8013943.1 CDP-diacylglycerol--serine O-phosphatidyltransferase [Archaeoglobaceae archaeon]